MFSLLWLFSVLMFKIIQQLFPNLFQTHFSLLPNMDTPLEPNQSMHHTSSKSSPKLTSFGDFSSISLLHFFKIYFCSLQPQGI